VGSDQKAESLPSDARWQLGYTLMAQGSAKSTEIRQRLSSGDQVGSLELLEDVPELAALVSRCWHRDPMARPTVSDIVLTLIGLFARVASVVIPAHSDIR
jgi:hypothetical protein